MTSRRRTTISIALVHSALSWAPLVWFALSDNATVHAGGVTLATVALLAWILVIARRSRLAWAVLVALDAAALILTSVILIAPRGLLWLLPVAAAARIALLLSPPTTKWISTRLPAETIDER